MSNLEAMSPNHSPTPDSASTSAAGIPANPPEPAPADPSAVSSGAAANDTIFGRILRGEIPCDAVYTDDLCLAFRDVNPQAPLHVLVIPREALVNLGDAGEQHRELLGHLLLVAAKVARQEGLEGWRTVINSGAEAGQTVFHLHVHVIGGRPLAWPPG
jgi:histidine triad (HIT) family protein